jgi:hypothetical protein
MVNLASMDSFRLPLKQCELADAQGCSAVQVNRVMQELRRLDLIRTSGQLVVIPNLERFEAFAGFNSAYLHIGKEQEPMDRVMETEAHRTSTRAHTTPGVQLDYHAS